MSPDDYLLLATTVALLVFVVALATSGGKPKKTSETPKEITRWKRYRVCPEGVCAPLQASRTIVEEEPKGLKLVRVPTASPHRLRASRADGSGAVDLVRKWGFGRWMYRVSVEGKARATVAVPKRQPSRLTVEGLHGGADLRLRGAPADREYEVLQDGRLVAIVSWQRAPEETGETQSHYIVEVEKATEELPVLALVLAVERALG